MAPAAMGTKTVVSSWWVARRANPGLSSFCFSMIVSILTNGKRLPAGIAYMATRRSDALERRSAAHFLRRRAFVCRHARGLQLLGRGLATREQLRARTTGTLRQARSAGGD
jgi:hypothetical protein